MLAGQQPQDPRWQPQGEPAPDQLRPPWQHPYGPAAGARADADTHVFSVQPGSQGYQSVPAPEGQAQARALDQGPPQAQAYGVPGGEAYPPPGGAYPPPPGYTPPGQAYAGPGQPGMPLTGAPPGYSQAQAQWQAPVSGLRLARPARSPARSHSKGFLGSLFDFSFSAFVTPKLIKTLYVLAAISTALWGFLFILYGFHFGRTGGGIFMLVIVVPLFGLLTLGGIRLVLEVFMVLHRIHEDIQAIRARGDGDGTLRP